MFLSFSDCVGVLFGNCVQHRTLNYDCLSIHVVHLCTINSAQVTNRITLKQILENKKMSHSEVHIVALDEHSIGFLKVEFTES